MNAKKAKQLRRAIRFEFNMLPERNLHVVKDNAIPYVSGTTLDGKPKYSACPAPVLAHKDCQRAIYQATKRNRMVRTNNKGTIVVNPLISGVFQAH